MTAEHKEQNKQTAKHKLQPTISLQCAKEHRQRKQPPHKKESRHRSVISRSNAAQKRRAWEQNQRHQRPLEKPVRGERHHAESVAFFEFHNAHDDLCQSTVCNAHCKYHAV